MSYPDGLLNRPRLASILLALAPTTCLQDPGFVCDESTQCIAADGGVCTSAGHCAYPDEDCASRQRYGDSAPTGFAGVCVGEENRDPPESKCGNGAVDDLETCDDHNREAGDACHPQCVEPGTILWTVRYDGEAHSEDKGYGIAIDPDSETFYIAGFTTVDATQGQDTLVQRRWIETGELIWSQSTSGDARADDSAENVDIDDAGDIVVAGVHITMATGADIWVQKLGADGQERWSTTHDEAGGVDRGGGIAITTNGSIVVVGSVEIDRGNGEHDSDAWITRLDRDGTLVGAPLVLGSPGVEDIALDANADGDDFLVTGRMTDTADFDYRVWTARYGPDDVLAWEDLASADPVGDEPRGVGLGCDGLGVCGTAGVLSNDMWIRLFDATGMPTSTITEHGNTDMHDEAADIAFVGDGSFVVVGFIDYATEGFATGDSWISHFGPDGEHHWIDTYDGPAHEVDKALAVEVTDDLSAIVTGYETVPGQARDVWIRRYAI